MFFNIIIKKLKIQKKTNKENVIILVAVSQKWTTLKEVEKNAIKFSHCL